MNVDQICPCRFKARNDVKTAWLLWILHLEFRTVHWYIQLQMLMVKNAKQSFEGVEANTAAGRVEAVHLCSLWAFPP